MAIGHAIIETRIHLKKLNIQSPMSNFLSCFYAAIAAMFAPGKPLFSNLQVESSPVVSFSFIIGY